ncbi:prepilin-type N-terminal cleavage/methylation domain-containing protein [Candidatus Saccharibacteria bacterium]|nr:prepilin-type N-terminal cleavage/methylation domain-containing protein [Candidatus Saccharibacteria bacterium]
MWAKYKQKSGFTIVELLIVIVVIGILAAITIVAYNGINNRALTVTLKSDLVNASDLMELASVGSGNYPTSFPSGMKASKNVVLSLSETTTGYCVNAELSTNSSIRWRHESTGGGLQEGLCSGAVIPGSELGSAPNLITNTDFATGWNLNFQVGAGRSLSTRPGVSGDPYPSRPVLVLNNTSTATTAWAVLQGTEINRAAIITGKTYIKTFYVRKTGTGYDGGMTAFGVLDGNGTNYSLGFGAWNAASTSWQKITASAVASQTPPASNVVYQSLSTTDFTKIGWTLEFQGFEIREQI